MQFKTTQQVLDLGVKTKCFTIKGLTNVPSHPDFEQYKKTVLEKLKSEYSEEMLESDPILEGFRTLHTKVERSNRKYVSSPENLIGMFLRNGSLPSINL